MISLRTALCLSGLMVIATGSAALDAPPDTASETKSTTSVMADEARETTSIAPEASARDESAAQTGGETVAEPALRD